VKYPELLWIFSRLPEHYVVLDTETTGLPDEEGLPDIITLGITVVRDRSVIDTAEFSIRPQRTISKEAEAIHGISNEQASGFRTFDSQWPEIADWFNDQLVVIHNASFDWPVLLNSFNRWKRQRSGAYSAVKKPQHPGRRQTTSSAATGDRPWIR